VTYFELRVPKSLAGMPGRFVGLCWDEDDSPVKQLPKPRITLTTQQRTEIKRRQDAEYYAKNKERISAQRKARYKNKPRTPQTPEQRAAQKALYWATNRERITKRRKELRRKNETRSSNCGPLTSSN